MQPSEIVQLSHIIGGGQTIGQLASGKKVLVWGGLPGEKVLLTITKKRSSYNEAVVQQVVTPSTERIAARDLESFLSTSPWQIMTPESEQHYKAALIEEAFELHDIVLPRPINVSSDGRMYEYRNKVEFSWWWDNESSRLDLAFFRRGSHGKIAVEGTSLAHPSINDAARRLRDILRSRNTEARALKTVIVRRSQTGDIAMQLYVKDESFEPLRDVEFSTLSIQGFELIYSHPKSPASVISKRLQHLGTTTLTDIVRSVSFSYATEGFFQINLPIYEQALEDIAQWIDASKPVLDLYSGVGTIGLTTTGAHVTLVESNEHAVREMEQNIRAQGRSAHAQAVLATSESALEYITGDKIIIVDPPRAGLHNDVIHALLEAQPDRIIYLSCNPVTQARDVALLATRYGIRAHQGYNFFPRTPHIEHLVILDKKD